MSKIRRENLKYLPLRVKKQWIREENNDSLGVLGMHMKFSEHECNMRPVGLLVYFSPAIFSCMDSGME